MRQTRAGSQCDGSAGRWPLSMSMSMSASGLALAALLAGCATPPPSTAPATTGAAGGGTAVGADAKLQTCTETVGTVRLQDSTRGTAQSSAAASGATASLLSVLGGLTSLAEAVNPNAAAGAAARRGANVSLDSLRLLIQQSNCFVILDRGLDEADANDEVRRANSADNAMRDGANMGAGQQVAADFVLRSSVISLETTQSSSFGIGTFLPKALVGGGGSSTVSEAKVQLVLSDVRSRAQIAVAQGEGSGANTRMAAGLLGLVAGGGGTTEKKTSPTTIVLQAFADAYNKMVPAIQNYKGQSVRGGLGTGGLLRVQGNNLPPPPPAPAPAAPAAATPKQAAPK